MLGMSIDQMRTMAHGFEASCRKVVEELGIQYTPLLDALRDTVNSLRGVSVPTGESTPSHS